MDRYGQESQVFGPSNPPLLSTESKRSNEHTRNLGETAGPVTI